MTLPIVIDNVAGFWFDYNFFYVLVIFVFDFSNEWNLRAREDFHTLESNDDNTKTSSPLTTKAPVRFPPVVTTSSPFAKPLTVTTSTSAPSKAPKTLLGKNNIAGFAFPPPDQVKHFWPHCYANTDFTFCAFWIVVKDIFFSWLFY